MSCILSSLRTTARMIQGMNRLFYQEQVKTAFICEAKHTEKGIQWPLECVVLQVCVLQEWGNRREEGDKLRPWNDGTDKQGWKPVFQKWRQEPTRMSGTIKSMRFWNNVPTGTVRGKASSFSDGVAFSRDSQWDDITWLTWTSQKLGIATRKSLQPLYSYWLG